MKKILKWKPKIKFNKGIEITINWYIKNKDWWLKIKKKQEYIKFYKNWYGNSAFSKIR